MVHLTSLHDKGGNKAEMDALELLTPQQRGAGSPPDCPYAPLIGSWDIRSRWYSQEGSTREAEGEWHFSWILGGWGIQDVLFERGATADQRGTSIRCYDGTTCAWRVVWMAPRGGEFVALVGRLVGERIIQEGDALDGSSRQRWTISNITADGFLWQGETSLDGGATWRLDQEMWATRQPT